MSCPSPYPEHLGQCLCDYLFYAFHRANIYGIPSVCQAFIHSFIQQGFIELLPGAHCAKHHVATQVIYTEGKLGLQQGGDSVFFFFFDKTPSPLLP